MESRIMQVFYGNDCLPYKDSARSVHYPIVGNSFIGASGTTQIRFYVRDIGGVNNVSWVAISKLPNGQIGNQVLSTIALDSELGEYYVALDLGSYYTQLKGDVYISLNGYQGGIEVEQDAGTGIYTITGTPIIEATGSIKLAINYAPQLPLGHHFQIDDLQQILGLMSEKANIVNTIQIINNIYFVDLSGFEDGQLFYSISQAQYYKKVSGSLELVDNGNGILASSRVLVRYLVDMNTTTLQQLYGLIGRRVAIISTTILPNDYLIQFEGLLVSSVRAIELSTLKSYYAQTSVLPLSNYISALLTSTYSDDIIHDKNKENFIVPYSGALNNVDLGEHDIKAKSFTLNDSISRFIRGDISDFVNLDENDAVLETPNGKLVLGADEGVFYGDSEIANQEWTNESIASAISSIKQATFIQVDTSEYPTLEDFLDSEGEEGDIYLYPIDTTDLTKGYYQYIWEDNNWLDIGTTQIDLSNYYTKEEVDSEIDNVNANVPKHQVETIFIVDALTNINGRTFQNYTSQEITMGSYSGIKILRNGNALNETYAKEYMEYMCGSYYLPKYNYDKPKNTYFITPSGHIYKPQYDNTNGLVLYDFGDLATKDYANTKVDKTNVGEKVYGTDELGTQTTYDVDSDLVGSGAIVRRETSTGTVVVGTPTSNTHATTKQYVDNAISNAISNVYKIKGSKTVAEINALTGMQVGDVYNLLDSGTITLGSLQVFTGDNIVWTGSAWDKLGAEIDWSAYDEKFIAAGFFEVQPYNENTGEITFVYSSELYIMSYDADTGVMTISAN